MIATRARALPCWWRVVCPMDALCRSVWTLLMEVSFSARSYQRSKAWSTSSTSAVQFSVCHLKSGRATTKSIARSTRRILTTGGIGATVNGRMQAGRTRGPKTGITIRAVARVIGKPMASQLKKERLGGGCRTSKVETDASAESSQAVLNSWSLKNTCNGFAPMIALRATDSHTLASKGVQISHRRVCWSLTPRRTWRASTRRLPGSTSGEYLLSSWSVRLASSR
mmetsp:Transcript_4853/g.8796  ORF Transcript_4853/g.8796 Transcript_4853/m.8796 type:complete len:225 (+) Transcript_4853:77-751(+)